MDTVKPKVTPKDFFLWLGAMVALYWSAVSLIILIHQYINVLFPSDAERYGFDPYSASIRFAIASLVVVFPIYIWLTRVLHQDIRAVPEKKDLWVRRWLIFITLFVAGATIAGDLVATIYTYLEGDLTTRFILKALTILLVLGAGFWYYFEELRGRWERQEGLSKAVGGLAALAVAGAIVGGFFIIGSPEAARLNKIDSQKVMDLQTVQYQIVSYWQQKEKLPTTIAALEDPIQGFVAPRDPQTGEPYRYIPGEGMSFQLCATFNLASESDDGRMPVPAGDPQNQNWRHGAGETCFERVIDPDLYPPLPKPLPMR